MTIQITIGKQKVRKEALKQTNCRVDSVERNDDREKNKKTKREEPVRTITTTTKCDLVNTKEPNQKFKKKISGSYGNEKIEVSKAAMNKLLGMTYAKQKDGKAKISVAALRRALKAEGSSVGEVIRDYLRNKFSKDQRIMDQMDHWEKKQRKKELNKKYSQQRKDDELYRPLMAINKDFMSLAAGVAETAKKAVLDPDLMKRLKDREDQGSPVDQFYKDLEEKNQKKKKNCVPGNVFHDPETGEFTDKKNAGSWSLQWSKSRPDCKGGVAAMSGGSERFTKIPCGRADKDGGKAPNKCSGKKKKP